MPHPAGPEPSPGRHALRRSSLIAIVDANPRHGRQIQAALCPVHPTTRYADARLALAAFRDAGPGCLPGCVIVDADAPPFGVRWLIEEMRRHQALAKIPVVVVAKDERAMADAVECGAAAFLVKPFRPSAVIRMTEVALGQSLDAQWDALPPSRGQILRKTKAVFDHISDIIGTGAPIDYPSVTAACLPLVDAVAKDDFHDILAAVSAYDDYTYVHSLKTAIGLLLFGRAIGVGQADMELLAAGGLLHDVGKVAIPHEILNKPAKLTPEEFTVMRTHVERSVAILEEGRRLPRGIITIAGKHHEFLDGSGYPYGLAAPRLNDLARMASIVDIFGALTDRRAYKAPMSPDNALAVMAEMAGKIDQHLLSMFREVFLDSGMGRPHERSKEGPAPSDSMGGKAVTRTRTRSA